MPGFQKEYEIHYYEIDKMKEATPVTILHFLQDLATFHTESVGLGLDRLSQARTGWVLNRWLLKMDKYPRLGDKILLETWLSRVEHFYTTREFIVVNSGGRQLGRASSIWIYLNIDTKRPLRIPEHFGKAYGLDESRSMHAPFKKALKMTEIQTEMNFHVRRSDIDTNDHVNNARYVDWMLEGIPAAVTNDYLLHELEVIYRKETKYGTDIFAAGQLVNQTPPEYFHKIMDATRKHELAAGRTLWKKR